MQHLTMSPPGSQVSFYLKQFVTFGICVKMYHIFGIILINERKILRRPWKTVQDFFRKLSVLVAEDGGDGVGGNAFTTGDDELAAAQPGVGGHALPF